ncbi:MAG: hypothetical protein LIR50_21920 [Bacillota bacterium]|nr:hypothetical protein [Bacillota bacterium]
MRDRKELFELKEKMEKLLKEAKEKDIYFEFSIYCKYPVEYSKHDEVIIYSDSDDFDFDVGFSKI